MHSALVYWTSLSLSVMHTHTDHRISPLRESRPQYVFSAANTTFYGRAHKRVNNNNGKKKKNEKEKIVKKK